MKVEEIRALVKLMAENDLTEFKIEAEDYNLCIKRGSRPVVVGGQPQIIAAPAMPVPAAAPAPVPTAPAPVAAAVVTIDAPLVGTFYRSSGPDSAPFVQIGDRVTPDTTVCIIEAMKVMNEVKAEKSGVIKEILAENGQPVEYGQKLFVIE